MKKHLTRLLFVSAAGWVVSCASVPGPAVNKDVLSPYEEQRTGPDTTQSPSYLTLIQLLHSLGYEGVGMQFESESTLGLLYRVFSDPRASNRQIRLVYTGLTMAYDNRYQSLTVGGIFDATPILQFIQKNVPPRSGDNNTP